MFFFSSRRRHTRCSRDWSSDVCSSDLDDVDFIVKPVDNGEVEPAVAVEICGHHRTWLVHDYRDVVAENVPSPFPNRIVTVLSLRFTTARSSSPSLLKSPRTSVKGPCPTGIGEPEAALNVPSPLPSRMLTVFPIPSLTAKSALPSLLKSAATMPVAKKPTGIGELCAGVNVPSPLPSST